jgi:hypothetical protein
MRLAVVATALLGFVTTTVATAADLDDVSPRVLVFARDGKLIKANGRGKGETAIATLPPNRTVRALRVDSLGKILLADIGGTWAWMPLDRASSSSSASLTDLPCESGPAQLSLDGSYVLCRGKTGSIVVNFRTGKITPIDVPTAGARLTGTGAKLRIVWADAKGVWSAIPPQKLKPQKVAPQPALRGFMASPDGTHALGVYMGEVFDGPKRKKPDEVLMVFALDGTAAQRRSVANGVPVEWSHDSQWALVQDGSSACITRAAGGQYKCWRGFTAQSITSDGKYALLLGSRRSEETKTKTSKKSKKSKKGKSRKSDRGDKRSKGNKKKSPPAEEQLAESTEAAEGDEHGDEPVAVDEVPIAPPTGPLSLYRGQLDGPYTTAPQLVARDVDGAAVWIPLP